jgi:hypothetical protein
MEAKGSLIRISEILKSFPCGTVLRVWIGTFGGPSYIGCCRVEDRTIRHLDSGYTWGEFAWWFKRDNGYHPGIVQATPAMMYRVWEIRVDGDEDTCLAAVSNVRETSLRQEIADGRWRASLIRVVHETHDRNEARYMAGGVEL